MTPAWTVTAAEAGLRLDKFLAAGERLGSRSRAGTALDRGQVFVNDREATAADAASPLAAGDVVRLWRDRPGSAARHTRAREVAGVRIVCEDDSVIVVDKPAGVLTVPLPGRHDAVSVLEHLHPPSAARTHPPPIAVHRLDRDTSGLVVFARTPRAMRALKEQFVRREPERTYLAVVTGVPDPAEGTWRDRFIWNARDKQLEPARAGARGVLEAIAYYTVVRRLRGAALVEVRLVTGRRNQIRAQAALHGHPLAGERQYVEEGQRPLPFARQALHAQRLAFLHPATQRRVEFEALLPEDLQRLVASLSR